MGRFEVGTAKRFQNQSHKTTPKSEQAHRNGTVYQEWLYSYIVLATIKQGDHVLCNVGLGPPFFQRVSCRRYALDTHVVHGMLCLFLPKKRLDFEAGKGIRFWGTRNGCEMLFLARLELS